MPDSEMTMSASQFAQMLREKSVKFASVPDARLIEAFILRHPNYRVTYEGTTPVGISWNSPASETAQKTSPRSKSQIATLTSIPMPKAAPVAEPIPAQSRESAPAVETAEPPVEEISSVAMSSEPTVPKTEPVAACFAYAQVLSMRRELSDPVPEIKEPPIKAGRKCIRCGIGLPAFSKFCMECGAVQSADLEAQPLQQTLLVDQTKLCAACGEENPSARAFCLKCGMSLMKPATTKPAIAALKVTVRAVQAPSTEAPALEAPALEAPTVEVPAVEIPTVAAVMVEEPVAEAIQESPAVEEQPLDHEAELPEVPPSPSPVQVSEPEPVIPIDVEMPPETPLVKAKEEPPKIAKKCVLCLTVVPDASRFCPGCGADQDLGKEVSARAVRPPLPPEPPQPSMKLCPSCSKENLEDSSFCMRCGKSLTEPIAAGSAEKENAPAPVSIEKQPKAAQDVEVKPQPPTPPKPQPAITISIKPPSFASLDDSRRSKKSSGELSSIRPVLVGMGIVVVVAGVSIAGWLALRPSTRPRAPETTASVVHAPVVNAPEPAATPRPTASPAAIATEQSPRPASGTRTPANEPARPAASVDVGELKIPSAIPKGIAKIDEEAPPSVGASIGGESKGSPLSDIVRTSQANIPRAAAPPQRVRVSAGVISGFLLRKVQPVYPQMAREARISGTVVLQAVIEKDGSVGNIRLVSGPPMLVKSAMDAVKQWKYKPYNLNGAPIEVDSQVSVTFGPTH